MRNLRYIFLFALFVLVSAPRVGAQAAQTARTFYGLAAGASTDLYGGGSSIAGFMAMASLGRRLVRGVDLQFDAFVGQVALTVDQGFSTQRLGVDSVPTVTRATVTRATSVAGLTASWRLHLLSPFQTPRGASEIYAMSGAGAYYFSEHATGNHATRLGYSLGLGGSAPLRTRGPSVFVEFWVHALDRAHDFTWLSLGIRS